MTNEKIKGQSKIWIESDIMGDRTVVYDYGLPAIPPVRHCTFHYTPLITSNSSTLLSAEKLAKTLGAGDIVENINVGIGRHKKMMDIYDENTELRKILTDVLENLTIDDQCLRDRISTTLKK